MRYLLFLFALIAVPASAEHKFEEFLSQSIIFEVNSTDNDGEVVIFAKTEASGLKSLTVRDPWGHVVFRSRASDRGDVGIREYALETAEPSIQEVLDAWPEGVYTFIGKNFDGGKVKGHATLSHELTAPVMFTPNGDTVDASAPFVIEWTDVGAASYVIEMENDDLEFNATFRVAAPQTSIVIAGGLLQSGTEYEVSIAAVAENGNVIVAEGDFETQE